MVAGGSYFAVVSNSDNVENTPIEKGNERFLRREIHLQESMSRVCKIPNKCKLIDIIQKLEQVKNRVLYNLRAEI